MSCQLSQTHWAWNAVGKHMNHNQSIRQSIIDRAGSVAECTDASAINWLEPAVWGGEPQCKWRSGKLVPLGCRGVGSAFTSRNNKPTVGVYSSLCTARKIWSSRHNYSTWHLLCRILRPMCIDNYRARDLGGLVTYADDCFAYMSPGWWLSQPGVTVSPN